jgi:hypothetical protein
MPIQAASAKVTQDQQLPYDYDLFRKEAECHFVSGELLVWTADEGALDYALLMNQPAPATTYAQGVVQSASYNVDPGFRIKIGHFNAPKYYEVFGQYAYIEIVGRNRASKPSPASLFLTPTWDPIYTSPTISATSHIQLHYNLFDLLAARHFIPNPHLRLKFMAGATVPWISQDWKVHYASNTLDFTSLRNKWHYVGAGMRIGVQGDWYWGADVYMTGYATVAGVMGSYHNTSRERANGVLVRDVDYQEARGALHTQLAVGPSYQRNFTNNRVEFFTGYELNFWSSLHEVYRSTSSSPQGPKETNWGSSLLTLQGLTVRLTVDF